MTFDISNTIIILILSAWEFNLYSIIFPPSIIYNISNLSSVIKFVSNSIVKLPFLSTINIALSGLPYTLILVSTPFTLSTSKLSSSDLFSFSFSLLKDFPPPPVE